MFIEEGNDYVTVLSSTRFLQNSQTPDPFNVQTLNDNLVEGIEEFRIQLSYIPTRGVSSLYSENALVRIVDTSKSFSLKGSFHTSIKINSGF